MWEIIGEKVEVDVFFGLGLVVPRKFAWKGRDVVIKKVNLTYSSFVGRAKVYYFAVSDDANYFKLQFDTDKLTWTLVETYTD